MLRRIIKPPVVFCRPTFITIEYMAGNVDPIAVYKISVSGCKTMCFVETVAYDNNSVHVLVRAMDVLSSKYKYTINSV